MKKRNLGKSGFTISTEGFGCMGLSEFYGDTTRENAKLMIKKAIELGVTLLDTADVYAYGDNEVLLGEVLNEIDRSEVVVATKCGIVRDEFDMTKRGVDNSYEYILKSFESSSRRLNTEIDLYYLHRVVKDKAVIKDAMKAMAFLLNERKIKAVGLSEVDAEFIRYADKCLRYETKGIHGISAVQTEYSLVSRGVESNGVLECCKELDITFIAYSPICRGLLSGYLESLEELDKDDFRRTLPRFSNENLAHNNSIVKKLEETANKKGCTTTQLALSWLINSPYNIVPIPGTKREKYLIENCKSVEIDLTNEEWNEISVLTNDFQVVGQRYTEAAMKSYDLQE
ncbi:aldo/keto reductase [Vibrio mediterranei]